MENEEKKADEVSSAAVAEETAQPMMTMAEMQQLEAELKLRQNMPAGVLASIAVGLGCAALWALITALTHYQIGYMAWGVGLAVGATMKAAGKGISPAYGVIAAVVALLSCMIGNFLSNIAFLASEFGIGFWEMLGEFNYGYTFGLMVDTFHPMDALYYVLAVSTAFGIGYIRNLPTPKAA